MNIFFGHGMRAFWILVVENKAFTAGKICAFSDVFWKIGQHSATLLTMLTRRFYHKGSSVNWEVFEDSSYASLDIRTTLVVILLYNSHLTCVIFLVGPAEPFSLLLLPDLDDDPEALEVAVPARPPDRVGGADPSTGGSITHNDFLCSNLSGAQKWNKYHSEWRNLIFENHNLKNCFFSTLEKVLKSA